MAKPPSGLYGNMKYKCALEKQQQDDKEYKRLGLDRWCDTVPNIAPDNKYRLNK